MCWSTWCSVAYGQTVNRQFSATAHKLTWNLRDESRVKDKDNRKSLNDHLSLSKLMPQFPFEFPFGINNVLSLYSSCAEIWIVRVSSPRPYLNTGTRLRTTYKDWMLQTISVWLISWREAQQHLLASKKLQLRLWRERCSHGKARLLVGLMEKNARFYQLYHTVYWKKHAVLNIVL